MKGFVLNTDGSVKNVAQEWDGLSEQPANTVYPDNFDEIITAMTNSKNRQSPIFSADGSYQLHAVELDIAISRRQAFLTLSSIGITRDMMSQKISELPDDIRTIAEIEFAEASVFTRSHGLTSHIGELFNLSNTDIDELFTKAQKI